MKNINNSWFNESEIPSISELELEQENFFRRVDKILSSNRVLKPGSFIELSSEFTWDQVIDIITGITKTQWVINTKSYHLIKPIDRNTLISYLWQEEGIQLWQLLVFLGVLDIKKLHKVLLVQDKVNKKNWTRVRIWDILTYNNQVITKKELTDLSVDFWIAELWMYLEVNNILNPDEIEKCRDLHKKNPKKTFWEIVYEEWLLTNDQMISVLKKIWSIRIWEYFLYNNVISWEQLNEVLEELEISKNQGNNVTIWKILVKKWFITYEQLSNCIQELKIKPTISDIDPDNIFI